jgi:hypothetical protein
MKYLFFTTGCVFILSFGQAQSFLPAAKSFLFNEKNQVVTVNKIAQSQEVRRALMDSIQTESLNLQKFQGGLRSLSIIQDSLYKVRVEAASQRILSAIVQELNERSAVRPLAVAGISNMENFQQSYGSLSVGLEFRLTDYKLSKNNWIDPHFITLFFSTRTATSPDSASIQKTFMFPEINKRDFAIGYRWVFMKNDWALSPEFEFSLNRFNDTAQKANFVSKSFVFGFRVQKAFSVPATPAFLSVFPYYCLLNVDEKYAKDYRVLLGESEMPRTIHSLGLSVSAQTKNSILFCNLRYILNKNELVKSADLKTFVYTIGTLLSL